MDVVARRCAVTATDARAPIEDVMALSPMQQGLFSLAKLTGGEDGAGDPYVIAMAADITGALDADLLRHCAATMLARHPNLRVAFLEGNCSWLPFFLWRLDEHWERVGDVHAPELTMAPSAYWKRQCFASAEADEEPVKYTIDYLGTSNGLVFSTDFPHGDSKFPESIDRFLQLDISEADKRQILWDNCAAYYGITG